MDNLIITIIQNVISDAVEIAEFAGVMPGDIVIKSLEIYFNLSNKEGFTK